MQEKRKEPNIDGKHTPHLSTSCDIGFTFSNLIFSNEKPILVYHLIAFDREEINCHKGLMSDGKGLYITREALCELYIRSGMFSNICNHSLSR